MAREDEMQRSRNRNRRRRRRARRIRRIAMRTLALLLLLAALGCAFYLGRHYLQEYRTRRTNDQLKQLYNGAPAGIESCVERQECMRRVLNIPSGTRHELCYAVHAEQNAIIQAARLGISLSEATLYCTHQPCVICAKMIINSGIKRIVFKYGYPDEFAMQLFKEANVSVEQYDEE